MDEFRDEEKDPFEAIDEEDEEGDEMGENGMHVAGEGEAEPDELDEEDDSEFLSSEEER